MGHFLFCILHFLAFKFGLVGLFITIPLHLIYCAVNKKPIRPDGKKASGGVWDDIAI